MKDADPKIAFPVSIPSYNLFYHFGRTTDIGTRAGD